MKKERDFYQVSLKLFLKNAKGEILALRSLQDGTYAGYHDLPGGRIDVDEFGVDFTQILAREISEEIGDITYSLRRRPVAIGRHLIPATSSSLKKDVHVLYVFFEADYLEGAIDVSEEHLGFRWVNLKEAVLQDWFTSGMLEGVKMYLGSQ